MIVLHTFGPAFGLPDPSPFVMKAEMLLKFANLSYQCQQTPFYELRLAPKGKLPYIEDDGVKIPDSTLIRWHIERKYGIDFDRGLSAAQRGVAWAVEKLMEDHVYWLLMYERWGIDANFQRGPAKFFGVVPAVLRPLVQAMARRKVSSNLRAHGMGRYSSEEMTALAAQSFGSLAAIMGDSPYLLGAAPCGADATVFAFVAGALCARFEGPGRTAAAGHANLVAYSNRLMGQYFSQYAHQPGAPTAN